MDKRKVLVYNAPVQAKEPICISIVNNRVVKEQNSTSSWNLRTRQSIEQDRGASRNGPRSAPAPAPAGRTSCTTGTRLRRWRQERWRRIERTCWAPWRGAGAGRRTSSAPFGVGKGTCEGHVKRLQEAAERRGRGLQGDHSRETDGRALCSGLHA
jgi:hypothetical protein